MQWWQHSPWFEVLACLVLAAAVSGALWTGLVLGPLLVGRVF